MILTEVNWESIGNGEGILQKGWEDTLQQMSFCSEKYISCQCMSFKPKYSKKISAWLSNTEKWHTIPIMNTFWQWESDFWIMKLFNLRSPTICSFYNFDFNNLNRMSTGTMASSHVSITLCHGTTDWEVSVFSVHIVSTRPWIIPQPNAKVLDFYWRLLWYLKDNVFEHMYINIWQIYIDT